MTIQWENDLKLGVAAVDEQHEEIFDYFDKLTDALKQGEADSVVMDMLKFLDQYTSTHFKNEESLMELHRYPGLELQRQQHSRFRENITMLTDNINNNVPMKEIAIKVDAALIRFFITHIRKLDRELAEYIKSLSAKN